MAHLIGTRRSETFDASTGVTEGGDFISAGGGDDTIFGLGGDDTIFGGAASIRSSAEPALT